MLSSLADQSRARWLLTLAIALLLINHWPALNSFFTSDSLGLIRHCATLSEQGELWTWMAGNFSQGLSVESNYYRPLSAASICLDYQLFGTKPMAWHLHQLILHALNGLLLYYLGTLLAANSRHGRTMAALATLLFWLGPATPEVSLWIAGRYNVLATLFGLLALVSHLRNRSILSAFCMGLALCSKESAMILPLLLFSISWWRHHIEQGPAPHFIERINNLVRELTPSAVLFASYLAWRWYLFGDPLSVYPNSHVGLADISWDWLTRLYGLAQTLLPSWRSWPILIACFCFIVLGALIISGFEARRQQQTHRLWLLPLFWLGISILALLPHLQHLSDAGQGSRLLYNASAWLSLALALPWCEHIWYRRTKWFIGAVVILCALFFAAQYPTQQAWTHALQYQKSLNQELSRERPGSQDGEWAMLLIPDHIGPALVGRNAQGAIVLPPFQQQALIQYWVPIVPSDLEIWRQRLVTGVDWLNPQLNNRQQRWPSAFYCAEPQAGRLVRLKLTAKDSAATTSQMQELIRSAHSWQRAWDNALSHSSCANLK